MSVHLQANWAKPEGMINLTSRVILQAKCCAVSDINKSKTSESTPSAKGSGITEMNVKKLGGGTMHRKGLFS